MHKNLGFCASPSHGRPKFHEETSSADRQPSEMIPSSRQLDNALVSLTARIDIQNGSWVAPTQAALQTPLNTWRKGCLFRTCVESGVSSSFPSLHGCHRRVVRRSWTTRWPAGGVRLAHFRPRPAATLGRSEDSSISIKS